ncbi:MAG TPA: Npt1/Npt2 family nucleotide transporter [Thermoanaerobaculia bacterium]|nr:Npt1/Npt2 family nucleotide transporter [Thermoanaerobaculia bacterium]
MHCQPANENNERLRLLAAVAAFGCVAATGIVARTVGDTLFLTTYPPALLSSMYVITAGVIALLAYFYPLLSARLPLGKLIPAACIAAVVIAVVLRLSLVLPWKPLRIAAYVYGDLMCRIPMMLFWTFAALTFNPRESKRYLGMIGAAGTLASIAAGAAVRNLSREFGAENLLWLLALLLAGFATAIAFAARRLPERYMAQNAPERNSKFVASGYYRELLGQRQIYDIAALVLIGSFSLVLNDFTFKSAARALYQGAALASFFGTFYTGTSIVALIIQLFIIRSLLARGGVSVALLVLPAALLVTSAGVVLTGDFRWIVAAKAAEMVLEFTVNIAAVQMLFLAVRKQSRAQVRSVIDGMAKPLGIAVGGILLSLLALSGGAAVRIAAASVVVASLIWLWIARRNTRDYVNGLLDLIGARRLDLTSDELELAGTPVEEYVRNGLRTAPDEHIPYLLTLASEMKDGEWGEEYRSLLARQQPAVKVAALQYLARFGSAQDLEKIVGQIDSEHPEVREWALRAAARLAGESFEPRLHEALNDADYSVRAVAIAELLRGDNAPPEALASLDVLVRSDDKAARVAAASAIEQLRGGEFVSDLFLLLRDSEPEVRVAALRAAGVRRDGPLLPDVLALLADPQSAAAAAEAAVRYGSGVIPHLVTCFGDPRSVPASPAAFQVPAIATKLGKEALPLLEKGLVVDDIRLRADMIAAYCRICRTLPPATHAPILTNIVENEATAARDVVALRRSAARLAGNELLVRALEETEGWHVRNIFAALEALHPDIPMQTIRLKILQGSSDARSEAIELLDNVLSRATRLQVLSLFEGRALKGSTLSPTNFVPLMDVTESEWVTVGTVYAVGSSATAESSEVLEKGVGHNIPEVRETASYLMRRAADAARLPSEGVV